MERVTNHCVLNSYSPTPGPQAPALLWKPRSFGAASLAPESSSEHPPTPHTLDPETPRSSIAAAREWVHVLANQASIIILVGSFGCWRETELDSYLLITEAPRLQFLANDRLAQAGPKTSQAGDADANQGGHAQ